VPSEAVRARRLQRTFPTAASPSSTSFTLLLGFGGAAALSAMVVCRYAEEPEDWSWDRAVPVEQIESAGISAAEQ